MPKTIVIQGDGISVDLLLWREYGVRGRGLVEKTLEINPGLAALGPIIPHGRCIIVPDLPAQTEVTRTPVITLFGAT